MKLTSNKKNKQNSNVSNYPFLFFIGLCTLLINPNGMDPFLSIKASVLVIGGAYFAISYLSISKDFKKNPMQLILIVFSFWLFILFAVSDNKWISLFGTQGRSMGILVYLSLVAVMWISSTFNISKQQFLFRSFLGIGSLALFYGTLQSIKLDPFNWDLVYQGIIGFFGNPNFMGAFASLIGIAGFSQLLKSNSHIKSRVYGSIILILAILNIVWSKATQGIVSLIVGISTITIFSIFQKSKKLGLVAIAISSLGLAFFVAGLFKIGPLVNLVYKKSVSYRGDFWRTAYSMIEANPIFGVGFERFGVNYRLYRDLPQVLRNGVDAYSDNAHNVFLQFAATGGVFLAILYLALDVLIFYKYVKRLKELPENRFFYTSIFAIWLAIQAQGLISVDTPAIAVWGWLFAGFILGGNTNKSIVENRLSIRKVMGSISALVLGILFIFQLNAQNGMRVAFYSQIPKGDVQYANAKAELLSKAEDYEPLNPEWPILSANSLIQDNAYVQTEKAAMRAVNLDPKDYRGWYFLANAQENLKEFEKAINSRKKASLLDPYNSENLLALVKDYKFENQLSMAKELLPIIKKYSASGDLYQQALKELN